MRTIAVIGASYGGVSAARTLAKTLADEGLQSAYRVVLIDRNSHANHLYVLPRLGVLPGHEHKAFIPFDNVFNTPPNSNVFLHAHVTSISDRSLTLSRAFPEHGVAESDKTLHFDYLVYALGSHLPAPIDLWGDVPGDAAADKEAEGTTRVTVKGHRDHGIDWLGRLQKRVETARSVLVVGGGALGIQFASDIASHHPMKPVTLLHSRRRLVPKFDYDLHSQVLSSLESLGVHIILGERLDLRVLEEPAQLGQDHDRIVRTESGRELRAELILLCTGQTPNTGLLAEFMPDAIVKEGEAKKCIRIARSMQIGVSAQGNSVTDDSDLHVHGSEHAHHSLTDADPTLSCLPDADSTYEDEEAYEDPFVNDPELHIPYEHLFAIGDAADAFGALKAGHCAYYQAEVAARNIIRLIRRERRGDSHDTTADFPEEELESYLPGPPAIKLSLGLTKQAYQIAGVVGTKSGPELREDLDAPLMWGYFGATYTEPDVGVGV